MDAPLTNWSAMAGSADGNTLVAASMNGGGDYLGFFYTCHLPPAPELKLTSQGQNHIISWTLPPRKFVLQQNSDASTSNWMGVTTAPLLNYTNLQNQVTIPKTPASTFYRLRGE
jgi:hypothetical protein